MSLRAAITGISLATAIVLLPFSTLFCHLALGVFTVCWVTEGDWREKKKRLMRNPFAWTYIVLFLIHIAGVAWSENRANAWFNIEKKILLLLLPMMMVTLPGLGKEIIRRVLLAFVAACIMGSLICLGAGLMDPVTSNFDSATLSLYQSLNPTAAPFWLRFSYIELASGIGMHPTYLAMYLSFCIIILFHTYANELDKRSPLKKGAITGLIIYLAVFIVMLSSRIVTLATMLLCIAAFFRLPHRPTYPRVVSVLVLTVMLILVAAYPVPRYRSLQEPFIAESYRPGTDGVYRYSTGIRKSLWIIGNLSIAQVNPVFGAGTGDVDDTLRKIGEQHGIQNSISSYDPHNEFIFVLVGLGLSGLICLIACLALPAWEAYRQRNFMYLSFLFLFVAVCLTESVLESQKGIVFFSIFNSILFFQKHVPASSGELAYG